MSFSESWKSLKNSTKKYFINLQSTSLNSSISTLVIVKIIVDFWFMTLESLWTHLEFSEFEMSQIRLNCRNTGNIIPISSYDVEASPKKKNDLLKIMMSHRNLSNYTNTRTRPRATSQNFNLSIIGGVAMLTKEMRFMMDVVVIVVGFGFDMRRGKERRKKNWNPHSVSKHVWSFPKQIRMMNNIYGFIGSAILRCCCRCWYTNKIISVARRSRCRLLCFKNKQSSPLPPILFIEACAALASITIGFRIALCKRTFFFSANSP